MSTKAIFHEGDRTVVINFTTEIPDKVREHLNPYRYYNTHPTDGAEFSFPKEAKSVVLAYKTRGITIHTYKPHEGVVHGPSHKDKDFDWQEIRVLDQMLDSTEAKALLAEKYPGYTYYYHENISVGEEEEVTARYAFVYTGTKPHLAPTSVHTVHRADRSEMIVSYDRAYKMSDFFHKKCAITITI